MLTLAVASAVVSAVILALFVTSAVALAGAMANALPMAPISPTRHNRYPETWGMLVAPWVPL